MVVKTRKPETHTALVRRARKINRVLAETYPDAHIELDFQNPFQLLVATVMSALPLMIPLIILLMHKLSRTEIQL